LKIHSLIPYRRYLLYSGGFVFIFCLIQFGGCRKKAEPVDPALLVDAREQPVIRVLLLDDVNSFRFNCAESVTVSTDDLSVPKAKLSFLPKGYTIQNTAEGIGIGGWICTVSSVKIIPDSNAVFSVNGNKYRGQLRIFRNSHGQLLDAVNVLGIEAYLAGVIGAEMPSYWEAAALKAQTIAARTYCLYIRERFGAGRHWDVTRTAANQVYKGVSVESRQIWQAISQTAGKVLTCQSSDGSGGIFPAYYSSTCAGYTENSKNVFGDEYKCLEGVRCQYCRKTAKKNLLKWDGIYVEKSKVSRILMERYPQLKELARIVKIEVSKRSDNSDISRIAWLKLIGGNGKSDSLRGEDFRLNIDPSGFKIKSTAFDFIDAGDKWGFVNGKGLGHGVGMCQSGALPSQYSA